jgi:hypothetical protein
MQTSEVYYPDGSVKVILTTRPKFKFEEAKNDVYLVNGDVYVLFKGIKSEIHRKNKTIEVYWEKPTLNYCVSSVKKSKGNYFKFSSDGSVLLKTPKMEHWWGPDV